MLIALTILLSIALVFIIGKLNLAHQFDKQVKTLLAQSKPVSDIKFDYGQLAALPQPVQRFFKHVLKNGQPYIGYVRLTHDGQFKSGLEKDWMDIEGEQYFTTEKPGFIWKGTTRMFTARDMYIGDAGRLVVLLFSLFKVADSRGENFNEGELQRWLAESVWFPTNLLPSERLVWSAMDTNRAKLTFHYNNVSFFYTVHFNDFGEIVQMETQRFMGEKQREKWVCLFSNYQLMNEIMIPISGEVLWRLEKGDFSYAKFKVKTVKYLHLEK